ITPPRAPRLRNPGQLRRSARYVSRCLEGSIFDADSPPYGVKFERRLTAKTTAADAEALACGRPKQETDG
ncbi:hypothetical protein, partial [Rhodoblastus sp.]|uniref:hypothetical protein n=1 Tax=Rhodoblastus sp. TaxID=1962975 RepID=UPI00261B420E